MHTLMKTSVNNNVFELLKKHIELFESFENIYLFGSVLDKNRIPNDIDILLIYRNYSDKILDDINYIQFILEKNVGLSADLTVLSVEEEKDTEFLKRLNSLYLRLK